MAYSLISASTYPAVTRCPAPPSGCHSSWGYSTLSYENTTCRPSPPYFNREALAALQAVGRDEDAALWS